MDLRLAGCVMCTCGYSANIVLDQDVLYNSGPDSYLVHDDTMYCISFMIEPQIKIKRSRVQQIDLINVRQMCYCINVKYTQEHPWVDPVPIGTMWESPLYGSFWIKTPAGIKYYADDLKKFEPNSGPVSVSEQWLDKNRPRLTPDSR